MSAGEDVTGDQWDVIVIGGGPAGENAALFASQFSGLSALIVERELLGGECSFWACTPSKTLLAPIELRDQAGRAPGLGVLASGSLDVAAVLERRDRMVEHHDDASQLRWAAEAGIAVLRGKAMLAGERRVEVALPEGGSRSLAARHAVVVATGSRAAVPPTPGLGAARPWISRDVTNLHEVPRRVAIIGGGVVACESATWLRGLGATEVTIVEASHRLLARTEPFVGEIVAGQLRAAGVVVKLETSVEQVDRPQVNEAGEGWRHGGEVTLRCSDGSVVVADEVVVATGRRPNSDGIGLETVKAQPDGPIEVDEHLNVVGVPGRWLYAIGDVCGRALLTHLGKYQARICGAVIAARAAGGELDPGAFSRHRDLADGQAVPQVIFTSPPVASVGLTAEEARERGIDLEVLDYDLADLAGTAVLGDGYVGRARLVLDAGNDTVVGMTLVGDGTAELVHAATIAVVAQVPVRALWHAVPSFPTIAEVWLRLLEVRDRRRQGGAAAS